VIVIGILKSELISENVAGLQEWLTRNPVTIRYQLATPIDTLNVPFTNPWVDLVGDADCTLNGFAGTSASGYKVETINGKTNVFINLDGTNDFGQFANMDVLNPVGTDDFIELAILDPDVTTATRALGITRNLDSLATMQYGAYQSTDGNTYYNIEGSAVSLGASTLDLKYILFGRTNGVRWADINDVNVHEVAFANSITTRANTQLGSRSNSVDGITKAEYWDGLQGDIGFWKGAQGTLDRTKIRSIVLKAMKSKYGLGV